jgi:hypothetical protein
MTTDPTTPTQPDAAADPEVRPVGRRGLRRLLHRSVLDEHPDWKLGELTLIGAGLEFIVFRGRSPLLGEIALRTPHVRWITNDNDPSVDARDLLQQEWAVTSALHARGLPVPRPHAVHVGEIDYLASAFVPSDGSEADPRAAGALAARLHDQAPPIDATVMQFGLPLHDVLAERAARRLEVVQRLSGTEFASPNRGTLAQALVGCDQPRSLLHMDFRPANFLTREGEIVALVDWSNVLIGDPALELARIAESDYLTDRFLEGYGRDPFVGVPPERELAYRLDTAAMLAVVFLSEMPDAELATNQVRRAAQLASDLLAR